MEAESDVRFWLSWVLANTIAEALGLSAVLLVGFGLVGPAAGGLPGAWPGVVGLLAGVLLGIVEGGVVGWAQARVLRPRLPGLAARSWIVATIVGAMIAWGLGMLPSSLMAGGGAEGQAAAEPPTWVTLVMAAGLGLVAGAVLALPQWRVLRHHVGTAGLWVPANAAAWLCGMPIVFATMGAIPVGASVAGAVPVVLAGTAAAGAVVGAIHGAVLVGMLQTAPRAPGSEAGAGSELSR